MIRNAGVLAAELDAKNLEKIDRAFDEKIIDAPARDYLRLLYGDSMGCFKNCFYFLNRTLDAPKTPIYVYDPKTNQSGEKEVDAAGVGPNESYVVYHRFGRDPLRNQFFTFDGTNVSLLMSSIVTVVIAAQKNINRTIEKITKKYYAQYIDEIAACVRGVLVRHKKGASAKAVADKIAALFRAEFISNPAPEALRVIGAMFPDISADLVRELDKIDPPYRRIKDVYRMKILFDTVPQINAFIRYVSMIFGEEKIWMIKNKFYDLNHTRGYRDAKVIVGFDFKGKEIPMEIMCNVRTFFNAERQSHAGYEILRGQGAAGQKEISDLHHAGIVEYNKMICQTIQHLLHRVGWNIIYEQDQSTDSFFRGFPKIKNLPYPQKTVDIILAKIEGNVKNEILRLPYAPRPLSRQEELAVFRYITEFILFAALPYSLRFEEVKATGFSGKVFNFVMKELYRFHEHEIM